MIINSYNPHISTMHVFIALIQFCICFVFSSLIMVELLYISMNARSLLNKLDELEHISRSQPQPSIISVSETWCRPSEPDSMYTLDGYTCYRSDRTLNRGGGVALYILNSLQHRLLSTFNDSHLESVWVEIATAATPLIVASIYRPPRGDHRQFCRQLEDDLNKTHISDRNVLLLGDFNAKNAQWLDTDVTDAAGDSLACLLQTYGLAQHVFFPTCLVRGHPKSCLDLVITNVPSDQVSSEPAMPIGSSDHLSVRGHLQIHHTTPRPCAYSRQEWSWSWEPCRLTAVRSALASAHLLPTDGDCDGLSIDTLWHMWRSELLRIAHLYCTTFPTKPSCSSPRNAVSRRRPWITATLRHHISQKHALFRQYLQSKSQETWHAFKVQRNKVTAMLREAKSAFICQQNVPATDPTTPAFHHGKLHKLMGCLKLKAKEEMPDISSNGSTLSHPVDKATAFNNFFVSESSKSVTPGETTVPPINVPPVTNRQLLTFTTTPEDICTLLKDLDVHKAPGDDLIPTTLLKSAAAEISPTLCRLFNISFSRGELPLDWRSATVSPIHKKGSKNLTTNYRPISLLSIVSKVQERVVHKQLYEHLEPDLPSGQSGYRQNDGTELQLLRLVHEISAHRDGGHSVTACFFDLSKAFDRVWHAGLLSKLAHLGVHSKALTWLTAYLTNRRQRVRIDGRYSPWLSIPAGVPQGSVLGPLLFLAYTIDLPAACSNPWTKCSQYADDTALISHHANASTAADMLQDAVSSAAKWLTTWHLLVNTTKTVVMSFQRSQHLHVVLNGVQLNQVTCHRHLGLILQSNLRWTEHIDSKIQKARKALFQLHRLRGTLHPRALVHIYMAYVRPMVEYGSLVLSNLSATASDKLERLQRRAGRICLRLPLFSEVRHSALLHQLGLPSLSSRRKFRQAQLAHQLTYGPTPSHLNCSELFTRAPTNNHQLRRKRTYRQPKARTSRHRDSPINMATQVFDSLPPCVKVMERRSDFISAIKPLLLSSICSCSKHPDFSF